MKELFGYKEKFALATYRHLSEDFQTLMLISEKIATTFEVSPDFKFTVCSQGTAKAIMK